MATSKSDSKNIKTGFLSGNWSTRAHLFVRLILLVIIFLQVNYLGCRRYNNIDLSRGGKFTLSEQTLGLINDVDSSIKILTVFSRGSDVLPEVVAMATEYDRVGGDLISVEQLDLSRSLDRIAVLREKHKLDLKSDQVVLIGDSGRIRVLNSEELVRRDESSGRILEFNGEEKMTSAILEVTEQEKKKVYLVQGDRRGDELVKISLQLVSIINAQNASLEGLALDGRSEIPSDADALVIAGSTVDLTANELEMVRDFWEVRKGGLFILLDPDASTPNLNSILVDNGVIPNKDRVMTARNIPGIAYERIAGEVPVSILPGSGPTRELPALDLILKDRTQSLTVQSADELYLSQNLRPSSLMTARKDFWGETEFGAASVQFDAERDNGDPSDVSKPVITAAAIEKGEVNDPEFRLGSSRLVVVGNPNLISPKAEYQRTAVDFVSATINWVMNRDQLLGIAPRKATIYDLSMRDATFSLLQSLVVWVLASILLFFGALTWYKRRA